MTQNIIIKDIEAGKRLDTVLAQIFPDYSRSYFANLIKKDQVQIDGKNQKPSYLVKAGEKIEVVFEERICPDHLGEDIPLNIIYEDNDVIVLNKQPGITVHPGAGNPNGTIVNALINHFPQIKEAVVEKGNEVSEARPGIVHRLDKNTSGVMIVAKNDRAMHSLARQIQNRTITKIYYGLCFGWPKNEFGKLTNFLGRHPKNRQMVTEIGESKGKIAISDYKILKYFTYNNQKISLIEFNIHTGRTHQIRVQSKILGTPILGDAVYGNKDSIKLSDNLKIERQLLHAHQLNITLPGENKAREFIAPLPTDFTTTIEKLHLE